MARNFTDQSHPRQPGFQQQQLLHHLVFAKANPESHFLPHLISPLSSPYHCAVDTQLQKCGSAVLSGVWFKKPKSHKELPPTSLKDVPKQQRRSKEADRILCILCAGDRYVVVDCGGGTVDLTVHQIRLPEGHLKELYKASGGPYGSLGIDFEFEKLLCKIFGQDFIDQFKIKRPAAWVDLMIAFESRKRAAAPDRTNPLNINLPFSFIDYYKKFRGHSVEHALRKSNVDFVKWSSQGMLRMSPDAMNSLFKPTIDHIIQHLSELFEKPEVSDIKFLFLVGGFAESPLLQQAVQNMLQGRSRIIIPHDVGLTILKGAVLFGLDPSVIKVRRSPLTYGVGVLNRFVEGKHPPEKLLVKDGTRWCTDVFDTFIAADQSVALGEMVKRSYTPAKPSQQVIVIHVYCSEKENVGFISEPGVRKCGTLRLDVTGTESTAPRREIQTLMQFGDTEIRAMAVDVSTGRTVKSNLSIDTDLHAANGKRVKALDIFAYALAFFKEQALKELSDQTGGDFDNNDVRWVITVPAIWKMPAKQFMREAAYKSALVSRENPEQLIIALEPEAASIYCRKLRLHQMVDLCTQTTQNGFSPTDNVGSGMTQGTSHQH
ncbi:heat shock 70 kDa protein 12A [Morone saxatilis]|uniref:heat shock 70 kDa protein 12A n=1 Tax=Morone saxatilis TaxID=34816 RepID=UPI0015E2285A|nr:heat shock 70 kDa protein 12A [Morone saxatilis]